MKLLLTLRGRLNRFLNLTAGNIIVSQQVKGRKGILFTAIPGFFGGLIFGYYMSSGRFQYPSVKLISKAMTEASKTKTMNFIADAVEIVAPAVVHIEVNTKKGSFYSQMSCGSGFLVSEDGMLLTNAHVVGRANRVSVKLPCGRTYEGYVVDCDEETDLAAIKLDNRTKGKFPFVTLGTSSKVRPGEFVAALGSPLQLSNTVTSGIVSSLHRGSGELGMRNKDMGYIQTDAAINIGNSGGPLVNLDGEVIGINCITVQQASGISFAIPSDVAAEFLEGAMRKEKNLYNNGVFSMRLRNDKFYIGITMLTLTPHIINELQHRNPRLFGDVKKGVLVAKVYRGSPSERNGVISGDIIISINNKEVNTTKDVYNEVRKGEMMVMKVQRGNNTAILNVEPEISSKL